MTAQGLLNWLDVLNADTTWSSTEDLHTFVSNAVGKQGSCWSQSDARISDKNAAEIRNAAIYMRYQLAAQHFNAALNLNWANERLATCHFRIHSRVEAPDCRLPALRAVTDGSSEDAIVQSFINTFLLQFSQYIASVLEGAPIYVVSRCEGLYKRGHIAECDYYYQTHNELEEKWSQELAPDNTALREQLLDFSRCADFFTQKGNGKFCSDTCRFSTFAIRKQLAQPNYHAEKQKRYRSKTKGS